MIFKQIRVELIRLLIELNEIVVFNRRLLKFYKNQVEDPLNRIIDVGANAGQSIDLFLKLNKDAQIWAFEPNPNLFAKLVKKYKNKSNVTILKLGISDSVGTKIFNENILHSTSSLEEPNLDSEFLKKKASVLGVKSEEIIRSRYGIEVTTLSTFIEETIDGPIDLIKIDTEGHEYACLKGLFTGDKELNIKYIQLEQHNDDMYDSETTKSSELLIRNSFSLSKKIKHGFGNFDEVIFKKNKV